MLIVAICEDEPYFQADLKNMAEQYSQERKLHDSQGKDTTMMQCFCKLFT